MGYIPEVERGRLFEAYYSRIQSDGPDKLVAARHWYAWEDAIVRLRPSPKGVTEAALRNTNDVLSQAIMETHYFRNRCFLSEFGADNFILGHLDRIAHVPVTIVQGLYDQCTPRCMADELVDALNAARRRAGQGPVYYELTVAGHTMMDAENQAALVRATCSLPAIEEALA